MRTPVFTYYSCSHKQAALLFGSVIMDQISQSFRRRGKIPGEAFQAQILRCLPPDQFPVEGDLIALQGFIASFTVVFHNVTPL